MARLRSSRASPPNLIQEPFRDSGKDEEMPSIKRSAESDEREYEGEDGNHEEHYLNQRPAIHEFDKTPATGFLKRYLPNFSNFLGTPRSSQNRSDLNDSASTLVDANTEGLKPSPPAGVTGDAAEKLIEANEDELTQTSSAERQRQDPEAVESESVIVTKADETLLQIGEKPERPNRTSNKLNKANRQDYNDDSFWYSRPTGREDIIPERDVYDFSPSTEDEIPSKTETAAKHVQPAKKANAKVAKRNTTRKSAPVSMNNDENLEVEDVAPPKRRGRPPKNPQQRKTNRVELPEIEDLESVDKLGEAGSNLIGSPERTVPETRTRRGRSKTVKNDEKQESQVDYLSPSRVSKVGKVVDHQNSTLEIVRSKEKRKLVTLSTELPDSVGTEQLQELTQDQPGQTIETSIEHCSEQEEDGRPTPNESNVGSMAEVSKKRTNVHVKVPGKPRKKLKPNSSSKFDEDSHDDDDDDDDDDGRASSRSQSTAAPNKKPRSVILKLAAAEELARQKRKNLEIKERELQLARREAEDAELTAERLRSRLDTARDRALVQEREAQGLPPLETDSDILDVADEEDFQNGVERVAGVFGTNNLSRVTSVPFSRQEKDELVLGLFNEKDAGEERYFKIYNLPIFRQNNRSFDEIMAKILDFKRAIMFDWETKRLGDLNATPPETWIMSIPDE